MRRSEVVGKEWIIPQERYKTGLELVIPLSPAAQGLLAAVPKIGKSGLVFTTDGKRPLGGFSKFVRNSSTECDRRSWCRYWEELVPRRSPR